MDHGFPDDFTDAEDPFALFDLWLKDASASEINDPEAMTLASVDEAGFPDARMVLCKGADARGLAFYGNVESAKGRELDRATESGGAVPLEVSSAASAVSWTGESALGRRERRLLRLPAAPESNRRLGEPAVASAGFARHPRGGGRRIRKTVRRERGPTPGVLARLAAGAASNRVLA